MSTGKRIAKRSIIGTNVCARKQDGLFYMGVICDVKPATMAGETTLYTVNFPSRPATQQTYTSNDLVGPGFKSPSQFQLLPGQQVFVTHNGREVAGSIKRHPQPDGVLIELHTPNQNAGQQTTQVHKRLDEVRLLASRKSARLMDSDTDFARLADVGTERKKSAPIEVPVANGGSRKRRHDISMSSIVFTEDIIDSLQLSEECLAALVLLQLSHNAIIVHLQDFYSECTSSSPSVTPGTSPTSSLEDESLGSSDNERKKRKMLQNGTMYQCLWPGCSQIFSSCQQIESHIRKIHIGENFKLSPHEEEFYYTEVGPEEIPSPTPRLNRRHRSPPQQDAAYIRTGNRSSSGPRTRTISSGSNGSNGSSEQGYVVNPFTNTTNNSPRKFRNEKKKCRKYYGMGNKESWCTQCKWKKACTRFGAK